MKTTISINQDIEGILLFNTKEEWDELPLSHQNGVINSLNLIFAVLSDKTSR